MKKRIVVLGTMIMSFTLAFGGTTAMISKEKELTLFHFTKKESAKQWAIINDTVMGGRSQSFMKTNEKGISNFFTPSYDIHLKVTNERFLVV